MRAQLQQIPPRGRYLAQEVGWLAGVSGNLIGQWARNGYIASSHSSGNPRVYSYQDVAEAIMVHELLERNVDLSAIKRSIKSLRADFGEWPLQTARIFAPGKDKRSKGTTQSLVVERQGVFDLGKGSWQSVIALQDLELVRSQLSRGGWAVRDIPDLKHIEVNPDRLSGRPTIRGRRLAAEDVAVMASTEGGKLVLLRDYRLRDEEIFDADRWWKAVVAFESVA